MNLGEMGNFISYAFAPASVVAPLGTVCILPLITSVHVEVSSGPTSSSRSSQTVSSRR